MYVLARPETLRSIVLSGNLPTLLPTYLQDHQLVMVKNTHEAMEHSTTNIHQTFVIECSQGSLPLDASKITRIICYSDRASKLAKNIPPGAQARLIEINPKAFEEPEIVDKNIAPMPPTPIKPAKRADVTFFEEQKRKKLRISSFKRLSTPAEHTQFLIEKIQQAKKTVLITSYDIKHDFLLGIGLYEVLDYLINSGVRVYIYYNDLKGADKNALRIFKSFNITCDETYTHSKLFCVDDRSIAIGSYNWLSSPSAES